MAALPQRLLGHPGGSALAVVGHVERAWAYSIQPPQVGPSLLPFRNFLSRVMKGEPVGHATRDFGDRFTAASVRLLEATGWDQSGPPPDEIDLARAWLDANDGEIGIVLGDPVARLRVEPLADQRRYRTRSKRGMRSTVLCCKKPPRNGTHSRPQIDAPAEPVPR